MAAPEGRSDTRNRVSFWLLAGIAVSFLFGASAPSPLYPLYQREFGFSTITVTSIYAVYAASGIFGLLVLGRLSDYVGRRPVAAGALIVQIFGMLAFIMADGEVMLYLGRLVQGLATGIGIAVVSAWLVDLQPADRPGLGALAGSTATMLGLGLGALVAGLLVQLAPYPTLLVYWLLVGVYAVGLVVVGLAPDTSSPRSGWRGALVPRIGVSIEVRRMFAALTPSLVALWALGGFYLALGPALTGMLQGGHSPIASGMLIMALLGTASVSAVLTRHRDANRSVLTGSLLLIAGVAISLVGVAVSQIGALFLGSFVAGLGFGPAFTAIVRRLTAVVHPESRGALLSAVYVVVYGSFSIPAVIAGVAVTVVGLSTATFGYGLAVIALAIVTATAIARDRQPVV